jgi:uroporphyrinogen-III synthase
VPPSAGPGSGTRSPCGSRAGLAKVPPRRPRPAEGQHDGEPSPPLVLVTRPEPGAARTARHLEALGFRPVAAPFLTVRPLPARLPAPGRVQAVLVASRNAVAALPGSWRGPPVLAVGDATAALAREAGFPEVRSASGDAAALADLAARTCDPAGMPLLLAAGRGQGEGLAGVLRARGFRVLRRTVYASVPVPQFPEAAACALRSGGVRAALFLSAETARVFARLLPADLRPSLAGVEALTISRPVAGALDHLPWRHVRVAVRPTQEDLLALL